MKYKHLFFDLDGTLTDPKEGVFNAFLYALNKFEMSESNLEKLNRVIGPPLINSFMDYYNFSKEEAKQAVIFFREYYSEQGIYKNIPYPGIEVFLAKLQKLGFKLYVATSKPGAYSVKILDYFNLSPFFIEIAGSFLDGSRVVKAEIIDYLIKKFQLQNLNDIVMIGDREHDIIGAKENHINSIAVSYGYGSLNELILAKPNYIAHNLDDLFQILIND